MKISVALVQMTSGANADRNLIVMEKLARRAAKAGAAWIQFPEMAYLMSGKASWRREVERFSYYMGIFQNWAADLGVVLVPGTVREPSPMRGHYYNSLPVLGPDGKPLCIYRKIHLFQANLPDRRYNEAAYTTEGKEAVVVDIHGVKLGLSVCFDLRFPELFRELKKRGAQIITVPSAFVHLTGKAHWEVLLRARAIENQVFILAPNQTGKVGTGSKTFGHTMAISPWGEVIAQKKSGVSALMAQINLSDLEKVTHRVDAWACRRPDLFTQL
jgi:deaminated glutathione amidase